MNLAAASQPFSRQINDMFVMRKIQGLPALRDFPEQIQCRRRPCVVQCFQDVIGYEREDRAIGDELAITCLLSHG